MTTDLVIVCVLLLACIAMFATGRPRMDVVAVLIIIALPVLGILDIEETLSGFADPTILLIAALFVVGEGLSRTGVTYRLGDLLAARAGRSRSLLIVLLMLSVAGLGSVMSSTGVVAIFIPVVLSIAARTGIAARNLMMPLAFAALISGMLTLIATTPNLIVDADLRRAGHRLGFFTLTPFGLVILALGIAYMLLVNRRLGGKAPDAGAASRRTFTKLVDDFGIESRTQSYRVAGASPLVNETLGDVDLAPARGSVLAILRSRAFRGDVLLVDPASRIRQGDALVINADLTNEHALLLGLSEPARIHDFYERFSREVGMAEFIVTPESRAIGRSARDLRFRERYDLTVLGVRHGGEARHGSYSDYDLRTGDTMLVAGGWPAIKALQLRAADYVALDLPVESREMSPAAPRAPFAVGAVFVMVVLMVTGIVPNVIAALIAAVLMGVFGVIDMGSAYRAIHWPTLLLIAGIIPFAVALEKTGGVELAVSGLIDAFGGSAPRVMLAVFFVATAAIGLFVSNTATAVLMAPVAIATAQELGVSPLPFAVTVALAASSAFMTPVSSPVNTLVVDPGRYAFGDFVRFGAPFALVVLVVTVALVPLLATF